MNALDRRLDAFRDDLADERLRGRVDAGRFVAGRIARVAVPVLDVRSAPRPDAGLDTQFLLGDEVEIFDEHEGWAWVQGRRDRYVGYCSADALRGDAPPPTHRVRVPRTFVYREPDMKRPTTRGLSLGCGVTVIGEAETRGTRYGLLASGEALVADHLEPVETGADDFVAVAETLLHTPYLWGGASGFGIDCSGLVQLSLRMCGLDVMRDTDMQATSLGTPINPGPHGQALRRGDLVYWRGHVAILSDARTIVHANGHTMSVARESLDAAIERIAYLYGSPTGYRRPPSPIPPADARPG